MSEKHVIKVEGAVTEVLPQAKARVELSNGHRLLARVAGRLRLNFVRLAVGDRVLLELSPFDLTKGNIVEIRTQAGT